MKYEEELDNYEDLRSLREAKETERDSPTISFTEAKKQLGIE